MQLALRPDSIQISACYTNIKRIRFAEPCRCSSPHLRHRQCKRLPLVQLSNFVPQVQPNKQVIPQILQSKAGTWQHHLLTNLSPRVNDAQCDDQNSLHSSVLWPGFQQSEVQFQRLGAQLRFRASRPAKGMAGESNQGLQAEIQCYQAQWRNIACVHLFKCWYTCTNKTHTDMYTHVYIHTYVRTYIHVNQQVHTHILAYIK